MSGSQRLLVIVGIVVVAAVGFVLLKGSSDDSSSSDQPAVTTLGPDESVTSTVGKAPARRSAPAVPTIVVKGLRPVGGVKELTFDKGGTIRFDVVSDQPEEIHLHGYDVAHDVAPGEPARFAVPAKIDGIFEAELEHHGTQIASITVEP